MKKYIPIIFLIILVSCEKNEVVIKQIKEPYVVEMMPGKFIDALTIDSQGKLWLSTSKIDTTIEMPPLSSSLPIRHYLVSYYLNTYTVFDDHFIGAENMVVDKDDELWFVTPRTLYYYNNLEYKEVYKLTHEFDRFDWIASDEDNNIWAGGNSPLIKAIKNSKIIVGIIRNDAVHSTSGHFDKNNNLWITLSYNGIAKRTPSGEWTSYSPSNSALPYQTFWSITSDSNNNIWAGTGWMNNADNLYRFDGLKWEQIIPKDGNGNIIYGTIRQLYHYSHDIFVYSEIAENNAFASNHIVTFDGNRWMRIAGVPQNDGIAGIALKKNMAWFGTLNHGLIGLNLK